MGGVIHTCHYNKDNAFREVPYEFHCVFLTTFCALDALFYDIKGTHLYYLPIHSNDIADTASEVACLIFVGVCQPCRIQNLLTDCAEVIDDGVFQPLNFFRYETVYFCWWSKSFYRHADSYLFRISLVVVFLLFIV